MPVTSCVFTTICYTRYTLAYGVVKDKGHFSNLFLTENINKCIQSPYTFLELVGMCLGYGVIISDKALSTSVITKTTKGLVCSIRLKVVYPI